MTSEIVEGVVAVLTDSRGFDTYYLNDRYEAWYGADKAFPAVLGHRLLLDPSCALHAVQIPDHFRSGTVENNLLRLGLCDPSYVVLCDGIWETLINREHLVDYVTDRIRERSLSDDDPLEIEVSHKAVTRLYLSNALSVSPARYAERIERLVSFFVRRRRNICWLSLLVPAPSHKNRIHYAGDYKCSPEWQQCLNAINHGIEDVLGRWGATYVDLQALMEESGGESACLLDQWHFTEAFHSRVADKLFGVISRELEAVVPLPPDHASRNFIVPGKAGDTPMVVVGEGNDLWCRDMGDNFEARPVSLEAAADARADVILLTEPVGTRDSVARELLATCAANTIVVYPDEIDGIKNAPEAGGRGGER